MPLRSAEKNLLKGTLHFTPERVIISIWLACLLFSFPLSYTIIAVQYPEIAYTESPTAAVIDMEFKEVSDKSGNKLKYKYYDGSVFPPIIPGSVKDHLDSLETIDFCPDDTIIWSYPKSGTHWLYEIVNMLRRGKAEYHHKMGPLLDALPPKSFEDLPSPKVFASHMFTRHLPKKFLEQKGKIVYIYRNPKDVSVSLYTFIQKISFMPYGGTWEDFSDLWMKNEVANSWFEYTKDVAKFIAENPDYPILTVTFEDMKKDLETEVKKIAAFLDPNIQHDLCKEVAEKCQFSAMHKAKNEHVPEQMKQISTSNTHIFYRKGDVGDWKNWYTVAMNEAYDRLYEKEMAGLDLDMKFTI